MSLYENAENKLRAALGDDLLGVQILPGNIDSPGDADNTDSDDNNNGSADNTESAENTESPTGDDNTGDDNTGDDNTDDDNIGDIDNIKQAQNLMIRVTTEAWTKAGEVLRDDLDCKWFDFLSAIDWLESPYGRQLDAEQDNPPKMPHIEDLPPIEHGILGGETRLQILARVRSVNEPLGIILKADVPDEAPAIESWVPIYPGADWHERETWEMFGIVFHNHPGLCHLYLPTEFEGYPLRKDFPLLARQVKPWPGIVDVELMSGLDDDQPLDTPEDATAEADSQTSET